MGEYAEMMLEGDCCEACGTYIGEGSGFARYCSTQCARDRGADFKPHQFRTRKKGDHTPERRRDHALRLAEVPEGTVTEAEIADAQISDGKWPREAYRKWGVPVPPPKGWRTRLTKKEGAQ